MRVQRASSPRRSPPPQHRRQGPHNAVSAPKSAAGPGLVRLLCSSEANAPSSRAATLASSGLLWCPVVSCGRLACHLAPGQATGDAVGPRPGPTTGSTERRRGASDRVLRAQHSQILRYAAGSRGFVSSNWAVGEGGVNDLPIRRWAAIRGACASAAAPLARLAASARDTTTHSAAGGFERCTHLPWAPPPRHRAPIGVRRLLM